jgi:cyclohexyl-isocyanide hydratase
MIGIVLFPGLSSLDVAGPLAVLARTPGLSVQLVAATLAPVRSDHGLTVLADHTFDTAPPLDVICLPGGSGVSAAMEDRALLQFLRRRAPDAQYLTSLCTGVLVLGAAGLLHGYQATTHRLSMNLLRRFGAQPVDQRIVVDRNRITGAGVTAGIDLGLVIASKLLGAAAAQEIRLMLRARRAPYRQLGMLASKRPRGGRLVPEVHRAGSSRGGGMARSANRRRDRRDGIPSREDDFTCVAIDSLPTGTTLVVNTHNSRYRLVVLLEPDAILIQGGAIFPEPTFVRLEGATAARGGLKSGWILVGCPMMLRAGSRRINSSLVRSVAIESLPAPCPDAGRASG